MNSNKSITGVFSKRNYPLNIVIEGEGTVQEVIVTNPAGRDYPHGTTVELSPIAAEGWIFDSWAGDLSGSDIPMRIIVDGEKTVMVKFTKTSRFYLAENGITCKCEGVSPGDKGLINGIEYEAVDNTLVRQRKNQGVDMTKLCTSLVTDMNALFQLSSFNQPIGNWDVGNVTNMSNMFSNSEFNQSLTYWNVSIVSEMYGMFTNTPFNQPIGNWDVSKVTLMWSMFSGSSFNQPIGSWDVGKVTNMASMFNDSPFNL
ncbi:Chitinase [Lunatimonas lonarensis]|uniref:Chitinase n=2 Tax=Lunatimonas lonarensis TaxID=1232681 RepID=R7ZUW8_9BACT|nr:Chitinase [Lunatimonas lonarensis]